MSKQTAECKQAGGRQRTVPCLPFGPDENCTREQMIPFLYRTAGEPEVSGSVSFSDVKKGSYYYNAVLWAYKNGITKGYSSGPNKGKFGVKLNVTREDTVTFIYRMAGKPKYSTTKSFSDVKKGKYYYDPVLWAAQNGITNGYKDGTFGVGARILFRHEGEDYSQEVNDEEELGIEVLGLSVRAYNCLKRAGFHKMTDFEGKQIEDISSCRGMREACLQEIVKKLKEYGVEEF